MTMNEILNYVLDGGAPAILALMWYLERKERMLCQSKLFQLSEDTLHALRVFKRHVDGDDEG